MNFTRPLVRSENLPTGDFESFCRLLIKFGILPENDSSSLIRPVVRFEILPEVETHLDFNFEFLASEVEKGDFRG